MAFTALKEKMTKAHVLALPNFSKPFVLEAYTNAYGIGEVLMQGGIPIAYHSKNLGPKAASLSTYGKEAMTIL